MRQASNFAGRRRVRRWPFQFGGQIGLLLVQFRHLIVGGCPNRSWFGPIAFRWCPISPGRFESGFGLGVGGDFVGVFLVPIVPLRRVVTMMSCTLMKVTVPAANPARIAIIRQIRSISQVLLNFR
jgi:hypothetical protein